ncbi:MAG: glycosyltransferase family 4 protein [Acidimicrobiales bacterium]
MTGPLRSLVFFDDRYHEVYGAQENLLLLAELCAEQGHTCRVATSAEGQLSDAARARGLSVEIIAAPPQLRTFERGTIRGGAANRYRSLRAWISYAGKVDSALATSKPADAVVAGSVRSAMHLTRLAARRRGPKVLLFAQNSTPFGVFAGLAAAVSDRILLIAPGAAQTFPAGVLRVFARRVRALPSGRDLDRYRVERPDRSAASPESEAPLRVITIGSVTRRKGLHVLIEALGSVARSGQPCTLAVVGGTSGADSVAYRDEIAAAAESVGVPLTLAGWHDDVVPFLAEADVFALASFDEGLPGVLLEAMAASLPCVTTEAGGSGELVRAAGCGSSVPIGQAGALADALMVMAEDPVERSRQGEAGRRYVERNHSLDAYRDRFLSILDEVLDGVS